VSKKSRDRHLAKQAARRKAERRQRRRRRATAIVVGVGAGVAAIAIVAFALIHGGNKEAAAWRVTSHVAPSPGPKAVACGAKAPKDATKSKPQFGSAPPMRIDTSKTYLATLKTSCGTIVVRLDAAQAPKTVNSLVLLARRGYFDGTRFHRLVRNFVIQGGDPLGTGSGGPGYSTVDPPPANAKYPIGTVAMAKTTTESAGTAGSQFFIVTSSSARKALAAGGRGLYAIVGHVVSGMDVVRKIAALPIQGGSSDGPPKQSVYVDKVTITAGK
jgi:peptidyl-prolyl cis-trans isomerase B (cyclophilin B)